MSNHIYHTIKPHDLIGDAKPEPEAIAAMREKTKQWPDCKWAAAQCVDLSSPNIGHLRFMAVGPSNSIKCVDSPTLTHWSYMFVGFVNLETGTIDQPEPTPVHAGA